MASLRDSPSISFCHSSLFLFLSVSVLGGERVKGGILGRRRCRWSPVVECWQAFSSHSSFEWTVHLGPEGLPPCVGQHAWGFGCLFLASFLLLINKNVEWKTKSLNTVHLYVINVKLLFKFGMKWNSLYFLNNVINFIVNSSSMQFFFSLLIFNQNVKNLISQ